jgi:tripartite-type tricarboxylate transporter receptor subunit TctC
MRHPFSFGVRLLCALALFAATSSAFAEYPERPIRVIVPFPAGGTVDLVARLVTTRMADDLKAPFVIENRGGGGGVIATDATAKAAPDGYTLLLTSPNHTINAALQGKLPYDTEKDLVPVAMVAEIAELLVSPPSAPFLDFAGFVAYAKANPGKLNYGASIGTPPHLLSTLFKTKAGIDVVYVPYKGSAASVTDLLSGQTQFTIDGLTGLYPLIQDGKLRPLAIARAQRWPELPDVPTLVESGFADFTVDAWTGVVAPSGTPPAIVSTLNRAINEGLATAEAQAGLARFSAIAQTGSPQEFADFIASELPKWAAIVKLSGARIE